MPNIKSETIKSLASHLPKWGKTRTDVTVDFESLTGGSILYIRNLSNGLTIKRLVNDKFIQCSNGMKTESHTLHINDSEFKNSFYKNFIYNTSETFIPKESELMSFLKRLEKEPKILNILNRLFIGIDGEVTYVELTLNTLVFTVELLERNGVTAYEIKTPLGYMKLQDNLCTDTFVHAMKQVMQLGYE